MTAISQPDHILAVDLGGTKVAVALITAAGELLLRSEEPTCQAGPQAGIDQIVRLLQDLLQQAGQAAGGARGLEEVRGIGVGIPAVLDPDDRIIWAPNLAGWREVDLRLALEERLGLPAFVEYDGHTAVMGEWWQGAGRGYRSIAMVIVGTGIGGGLILDGKLFRGRDRLAGAAGWFAMTADADLEDSRSQALGHWESLAAGPGIASRARAGLPAHPDSSLNHFDGLTARHIFEQALAGDPYALRLIDQTASLLGLGIANIVSLVNPEIVVLGGSIGQQGGLLLERVRAVVQRWAQPISGRSVVITSSALGQNAGLYGAAYAVLARAGSDSREKGG